MDSYELFVCIVQNNYIKIQKNIKAFRVVN